MDTSAYVATCMEDVIDLMATRDDSGEVNDPELIDQLHPHPKTWAFWQGYIQACCDIHGLNLSDCEGEYRRIMQVASNGEYGLNRLNQS